jgi:DNA mismatch repair protein MutS
LAGLPAPVLRRAETVLKVIETSGDAGVLKKRVDELPLFSAAAALPPPPPATPSPFEPLAALLAETDPDALTPRDALDLLYRLRRLLP